MPEAIESTIYEFSDFRLDAARQKLMRRETGEIVPIQPKAFELLLLLIENEGQILTREKILDTLWAENFVEEANLTQTVFVLRKTLGEDKNERLFIATAPHRGYRFIGKVEKILQPPKTETVQKKLPKGHGQQTKYLLIAIPLILLFLVGIYYFWREKKADTIRDVKSIAVLPFENIGGKADEDYLGRGLSDVLASKLSNVKIIIVRPASSVLKFAQASPDVKKIGADLNVEAVITGSVQRIDENIRVTVQLVRTSDGATLWAETFDDKFTNIFAVQDSISKQVTESLAITLTTGERRQIAKKSTENAEAFQFYMRGRYFWNKRTGADLLKAIENFERGIKLDSNYALAYSGLADCYILLPEYGAELPEKALPKAKDAIRRAIEIDGESAEIYATLGYTQAFYDWNWSEAEKSFKRALELNPNYATAHQWYAEMLADLGRFDEAHTEFARAMQIDPTSPIIINDDAHIFFNQRKFDESIAQLRKCIELEPNFAICHSNLGFALEEKGMFSEALEAHTKAMNLFGEPPEIIEEVRQAFARNGIRGFWQTRLEHFKTRPHLKNYPAYSTAWCYARTGDKTGAIEWLEKSFQRRERYLPTAKTNPVFDFLRDDPRFQELLKRIGL